MAWFGYLGILRDKKTKPKRHWPHLRDVMRAGKLEPRILELLPAILTLIPEAIDHQTVDIPEDLAVVLKEIANHRPVTTFRGVTPVKYMEWIKSPIFSIARRRIDFRKQPRKRFESKTKLSRIVKKRRLEMVMTQKELADKFKISLRVIRDLEQGKLTASVANVNAVLAIFGSSLEVR